VDKNAPRWSATLLCHSPSVRPRPTPTMTATTIFLFFFFTTIPRFALGDSPCGCTAFFNGAQEHASVFCVATGAPRNNQVVCIPPNGGDGLCAADYRRCTVTESPTPLPVTESPTPFPSTSPTSVPTFSPTRASVAPTLRPTYVPSSPPHESTAVPTPAPISSQGDLSSTAPDVQPEGKQVSSQQEDEANGLNVVLVAGSGGAVFAFVVAVVFVKRAKGVGLVCKRNSTPHQKEALAFDDIADNLRSVSITVEDCQSNSKGADLLPPISAVQPGPPLASVASCKSQLTIEPPRSGGNGNSFVVI